MRGSNQPRRQGDTEKKRGESTKDTKEHKGKQPFVTFVFVVVSLCSSPCLGVYVSSWLIVPKRLHRIEARGAGSGIESGEQAYEQ